MSSPLERAVEIMDTLRSPGGCPWDAQQTHESLTRYLIEEAYEVVDAIESGNLELLREELGDLLLQVLFHARIAADRPDGFTIDDVADDLVAKLVRRHPHVFAGARAGTAEQLNEAWEQGKIVEKARTSAVDGVPVAQPALALSAKLVSRARRAGLEVQPADSEPAPPDGAAADKFGARLFGIVQEAVEAGVDPETALRRVATAYRAGIVTSEAQRAAPR